AGTAPTPAAGEAAAGEARADTAAALSIVLKGVSDKDRQLLLDELGHLGEVLESRALGADLEVLLATSASAGDIEAVMCFVVEPEQVEIRAVEGAAAPADAETEPRA